jgi:hypothetical protein
MLGGFLLFRVDLGLDLALSFGFTSSTFGGKCVNFAGCAPVFGILCNLPIDLGCLDLFPSALESFQFF